MAWVFSPAIYRPGQLLEWPRPIPVLRVVETWDSERFKVPLTNGDTTAGQSRNGVDISLQGQLGQLGSTLLTDEALMVAALLTLRQALHVDAGQSPFWLLLYHDAASGKYRHWRRCSTSRFEYDLSDPRLFTYAASLHADDPVLYETTLPA